MPPGRKPWTRLLLALLLAALAGLPWLAWQSTALDVVRLELPIAGLAPDWDGLVIAQISDIHGRRLDPGGTLFRALRQANPEIIVATGDFVRHRASEMTRVTPLLRSLADLAPLYAVSGNHDHWADWPAIASELRASGAVVLENEHITLTGRQGGELILAGVSDPATGRHNLPAAIPADAAAPILLLAHAPTLHERRATHPADDTGRDELVLLSRVALTLCGHTHGGQIRLPLIGALSNASGKMFPRAYVQGLTWEGDGWLYINRGLGYSIVPLRLLCRPELTLITLRAAH